jgi:hypothetical protein
MNVIKTILGTRLPAPKGAEPDPHQHATPNERIESMLRELIDRTRRTETRVVVLMREHGIDPYGNPIDR